MRRSRRTIAYADPTGNTAASNVDRDHRTRRRSDMDLMTTNEVAQYLNVAPATLRWWRHVGDIGPRSFVLGSKKVMYRRQDVDAYVMQQINEADDKTPA